MDGFLQVVRPVLRDGRWCLARCVQDGGGGCDGKLCSLLVGGQMCMLGCKECYMVGQHSSSSHPNTGALSLLQIQLFSQVPFDVAFHSPALNILLPPPAMLHFLDSQAVSDLPI